jgi:uncharacterized repeat protein (TIGR03847 family)
VAKYDFFAPERVVVGTVGRPGERSFYLQVSGGGDVVTVGLEKAEVSALADGLTALLGAARQAGAQLPNPERARAFLDRAPLDLPLAEDFRDELTVGWDGRRVHLEATGPPGAGAADGAPERLRVAFTLDQAYAFVARALSEVASGRPPCLLCGRPDGPAGHRCPRLN